MIVTVYRSAARLSRGAISAAVSKNVRKRLPRAGARAQQLTRGWALLTLAGWLASASLSTHALEWFGPPLDRTSSEMAFDEIRLQNGVFGCSWNIANGSLKPVRVGTRLGVRFFDLQDSEVFQLTLGTGETIRASDLKLASRPVLQDLQAEPNSSVLAHRFPGKQVTAYLLQADGNLRVKWRAILRDGANDIRQEFIFEALTNSIPVKAARLVDIRNDEAESIGSVPGSPIVVRNLFFACEHPDAQNEFGAHATATVPLNTSLQPNQTLTLSAVLGIFVPGQLRRGFLYYLERERAHPYRPFLHYNAWYDLCWDGRKINEQQCLDVVQSFGRELIRKRRVPMASFVWDDGWDDPHSLWRPLAQNFPNGFQKLSTAAESHRSGLGFWLSPFGGYGQAKEDRLRYGQEQAFETGSEGFALSGPKYYARFLETCSRLVDGSGANFFKFDGLARGVDETEAMLRLTRALRRKKPDLFISITTGTWPSPYWLWCGDCTWRGGDDMNFAGEGPKREQWQTYRDAETFRGVVQRAPLYPLNSLMTQGFSHAREGKAAQLGDSVAEIRRDLRGFFASGTCLQELYVTPGMMSSTNWDDLAECARWSQANADVLVDTHWIGGNPADGQIYGWASWTQRKGILALRNPTPRPQTFRVDVGTVFELPRGAASQFALKSPWKGDAEEGVRWLKAGQLYSFELEPFAVRVYDALPR